jgi:Rrf2 family protein
MLDLALHHSERPVLLKDIARRQGISPKYLNQLIGSLKNAGLVMSMRGSKGGYVLAKSPAEINLKEIVHALEGSLAPAMCLDDPKACHRISSCAAREVWWEIKGAIDSVLESRTLENMAQRQKEMKGWSTPDYAI